MELKSYQKETLQDLADFLHTVEQEKDIFKAYERYLSERKELPARPPYKNEINGVPHVCFKVPTGGGKTFIAAASLRTIFSFLPDSNYRFVVWLVPSDTILDQTYKNLSNPNHPYNQRLRADFQGRVAVFTKQQMLNGMQFTPESVRNQLNVCVLSYDSFRATKKEGLKAYQENGNLAGFRQIYDDGIDVPENTDDTSLMQVIRQFKPVIIVDESHHASSKLSLDMLKNFNGSFILDLTATPKDNSNVISYVSAAKLKADNMVKLPVMVYNLQTQNAVIAHAIDTRNKLEVLAEKENYNGQVPIRPIVLFQAETKGKEDATTFEKIKKRLIEDYGIKSEEIAIKTANINELKNIELMSSDCPIRYIITINALKEGWDCPFAYILASLANKSSVIDVTQILGRVLRQPYTRKFSSELLNICYVYTASDSFRDTLDNIVKGLNGAGFSEQEYRSKEIQEPTNISMGNLFSDENSSPQQDNAPKTAGTSTNIYGEENHEETCRVTRSNEQQEVTVTPIQIPNDVSEADLDIASKQAAEYNNNSQQGSGRTKEEDDRMTHFGVNGKVCEDIKQIKIPQFFIKESIAGGLFGSSEESIKLTKERLWKEFCLNQMDTVIDFENMDTRLYKVDVDENNIPQYMKADSQMEWYFKEVFSNKNQNEKVLSCVELLMPKIDRKKDCINTRDLQGYLSRIVGSFDEERMDHLCQHLNAYVNKINEKIVDLLDVYAAKKFKQLIDAKKVECRPEYVLPEEINPTEFTRNIPKSLYMAEDKRMNDLEYKVIMEIVSLDNIRWWHRNRERKEFYINGFINHYPDFLVMTKNGVLIALETKGEDRKNPDSMRKIQLGKAWANVAGNDYAYFMVFEHEAMEGAYTLDTVKNLIKGM
jgi:type III restriction enzyme